MEIKPSHKAFWAVTKALKTEDIPYTPTQKPDNSVAIDDAEIAECLADSIETQCSHGTTSLISVASRKRHERTHSTRRLIRAGVPQGTLSPLLYSAYTNDVPRPSSSGVQLALFADDTALFYGNRNRSTRFTLLPSGAIDELGQWFRKWRIEVNPTNQQPYNSSMKYCTFYKARLGAVLGRKSKLSRRNKRTIYKMCIGTVMTYASPVFAHAAPKHYIDYRTPTISKYMKDASKRFFDIAGSHPNALLRAAVDYQPPHLIRHRPNSLTPTRPPLTSGRAEKGNRPVISCDIYAETTSSRRRPWRMSRAVTAVRPPLGEAIKVV
ncbi:Probable RNA-directed DNA polymerase from transposon BS [Eumeta japonica]|uniref:Probable RNA-directed DNA polymerase from transposon BS n=1 Tax=Eumeta variegata TaxID=151549 RepID=A0A4C1SC64_EUMVA|nr:Probable RNA-directed DNA polymerase from transposon BS [Eumeta japonica]